MIVYKITSENDPLVEEIDRNVPRLLLNATKGSSGRVGVIGGSITYTGAPYFSGISALRTGADLAYVFTSHHSSNVIKSYCPEFIVFPLLEDPNFVDALNERLSAFSSLIIGPGLGRPGEVLTLEVFTKIIETLKQKKFPVVIDADALYFLSKNPTIIQGYREAILTPNYREYKRLHAAVFGKEYPEIPEVEDADIRALAKKLGRVTILCKNLNEKISDGSTIVVNSMTLTPRRCGGQGDIMCGIMSTFTHWMHQARKARPDSPTPQLPQTPQNVVQPPKADICKEPKEKSSSTGPVIPSKMPPTILAALAASILTRKSAKLAFIKHQRGTLAANIIDEIPQAFNATFPKANAWTWN